MTFSKYLEHTLPLFERLQLLKISEIYKLEIAKYMHKIHTNSSPRTESDSFQRVSEYHNHNTRQSAKKNYFILRARTQLGKKVMKIKGPNMWHEVPDDLKNLSIFSFKKQYKRYLFG